MAKIARKHQKIFAGDIPDTNNIAEFGSLSEGTPEYSDDPDDIQSRTAYGQGWANAVINNYAPCLQDLNALFFLVTRQIAYLFQAGISEWLTTTVYYIGSLVNDASGGIYMSVADNNSGNALSTESKWVPILIKTFVSLDTADVTYNVVNSDFVILINAKSGYSSAAPWVSLPTPSALNSGREIIVKQIIAPSVSDGYSRVVVNGGSTLDGAAYVELTAQWVTKRFISNGTNWIPIN
jgi:hypothetical protein